MLLCIFGETDAILWTSSAKNKEKRKNLTNSGISVVLRIFGIRQRKGLRQWAASAHLETEEATCKSESWINL